MDANNNEPKNSKAFDVPITVEIMDLPNVIMVEILSRLPIKLILCCKTVCKLWYHLLTSDPLFLNMYHTRSPNFPCILLSVDCYSVASLLELKADYDYYSLPANRPIELSTKFHLPPLKSRMYIIASCNGLICLLNGEPFYENHSIYISNPILGEYFEVKLPEWEKNVWCVDYGFCFSEDSGQYKVLRLVTRRFWDRPEESELEVYTLGVDEKFRSVGQVPCPVRYHFGKAYVNGALHWTDREQMDVSIYSFDIGTEKLKFLPPPPGLETPLWYLMLAELENCLCLTDHIHSMFIDIWWMKEYGIAESWTKDSILVDSIPPGMVALYVEAILIWNDGEILIQIGRQLASYNPKTKKFREVNAYDDITTATRYNPSFYSLKTIMGDNFQVSYVYSRLSII